MQQGRNVIPDGQMSEEGSNLSAEEIRKNIQQVREKIRAACLRSGRNPEDVGLIAVSKKKPFSCITQAREAGINCFGENYVQELMDKIKESTDWTPGLRASLEWHMIGHLQRNKVKYLIGNVKMIHAVDSVSLAEQIEREAEKKETMTDILMEVNVAREKNKWGFFAEEVLEGAKAISTGKFLRLRGLMTSAPYTIIPENNRPYFRELNDLANRLASEGFLVPTASGNPHPVLSMGMSGDYEIAIEEGATLIRVGSRIFGERL